MNRHAVSIALACLIVPTVSFALGCFRSSDGEGKNDPVTNTDNSPAKGGDTTGAAEKEKDAVPGGKNWSSPATYTMNKRSYSAGTTVWIWPAEDKLLTLNDDKCLTVRFRWRAGAGEKPPSPGDEAGLRLVYPVRIKGTIRYFRIEKLLKLGPAGDDGITEHSFEIDKPGLPLDFSYTDERDCLVYLTANLVADEPLSNLLVLRCR